MNFHKAQSINHNLIFLATMGIVSLDRWRIVLYFSLPKCSTAGDIKGSTSNLIYQFHNFVDVVESYLANFWITWFVKFTHKSRGDSRKLRFTSPLASALCSSITRDKPFLFLIYHVFHTCIILRPSFRGLSNEDPRGCAQ